MYPDVADLREFYTSARGRLTQRLLRQHIRRLWPSLQGLTLLGLGFATPLLRPFIAETQTTLALMPAQQGVLYWPSAAPNRTALCDEAALPLPDSSIDRLIILHMIENSDQLPILFSEAWRVLKSSGKVLLIVPSRSGLWARSDATPFGHGRSYSIHQIRKLLRAHLFIPERSEHALFAPPSAHPFWLKSAPYLEKLGARWLPALGGVHLIEASKQLYAPTGLISANPYLLKSAQLKGKLTSLAKVSDGIRF